MERLEERTLLSVSLTGVPTWVEQGPGTITNGNNVEGIAMRPQAGAVNSLAPDPTNADRLFVASTNGGIWRTTNATAASPTWQPLTDQFGSLSIGDIAFSPLDPTRNTLFAGSGRFSSGGGDGGPNLGLLKTVDGGNTWALIEQSVLGNSRIVQVIPTSIGTVVTQVVLVATNNGVFRSVDGGVTFGAAAVLAGNVTDMDADPGNPMRFYAAVSFGGGGGGFFISTNGGQTWNSVNNNIPAAVLNQADFVEMAVHNSPGNNAVYAVTFDNQAGGVTVLNAFRSTNQGATWTAMDLPPQLGIPRRTSIAADPNNPNVVFVSSVVGQNLAGCARPSSRVSRGDASQPANSQWTQVVCNNANGTSPHPDSRDLAFDANGDLLEANDGGVYRLNDPNGPAATRAWESVHGNLRTAEFYSTAYDSLNDASFGGTQDNGTPQQTNPGVNPGDAPPTFTWLDRTGADGGVVQVDNSSTNCIVAAPCSIHYESEQFLGQFTFARDEYNAANNEVASTEIALNVVGAPGKSLRSLDGMGNFTFDTSIQFIQAYALNRVDPDRMIIGTNFLYESSDQGTTVTSLGGVSNLNADGTDNDNDGAVDEGDEWSPANPVGQVNRSSGAGIQSSPIAYGGIANGIPNAAVLWIGAGNSLLLRTSGAGVPAPVPEWTAASGTRVQDVVLDPRDWHRAFLLDVNGRVFEAITNNAGTATSITELTANLSQFSTDYRTIEFVVAGANEVLLVGGQGGVLRAINPDIAPVWSEVGDNLPNAIAYDLRYDAGDDLLLVGTFGRGAWTLANASFVLVSPAVLNVCGDEDFVNQDDEIRLARNSANPLLLDVFVNGVLEFTGPLSALHQVNVFGVGGNDNLTVDSSDGLINLPDGIRYDGDGLCGAEGFGYDRGIDRLTLAQTGGPTRTSDKVEVGALPGTGVSTIVDAAAGTTQIVYFEELEPVVDGVPALDLTIDGGTVGTILNANNAINYEVSDLFGDTWGAVTIDNFEPIHFTSKTTLTIDAENGDDTVNLNNPHTPTGLTTITVNGSEGDDHITSRSGVPVAVNMNGNEGNDLLDASGVSGGPGSLSGDDGDDTILGGSGADSYSGGPGQDLLFVSSGADSMSGGAGYDVIRYLGDDSANTLTLAPQVGAVITVAGLHTGSIDITGAPSVERVEVFGLGGKDTITVSITTATIEKLIDAGAGDDVVNASASADATIFGGDGDDTLTGTPSDDVIFAGPGNDILIGRGGSDREYGEDGNDRFGDLASGNATADDAGNDFFFGGDGADTAVWDPGDGDDFFDGGTGSDNEIFNGAVGNGAAEIINVFADLADPARARIFRNLGSIDIIMSAVEQVDVNIGQAALGTIDKVVVGRGMDGDAGATPAPTSPYTDPTASLSDLSTTDVRVVNVNLIGIAGGASENVFVDGRPLDDNILVSLESAATGVVRVAGLPYDVRILNATPDDRLTIRGNAGNDSIKTSNPTVGGAPSVESVIAITQAGGAGNDTLSADAILIGGIGNDFLEGGAGADSLFGNEGEDTMIGRGGPDTYDGGPDFDTILILGTAGDDTIDVFQSAATTLTYSVKDQFGVTTTETDTLVLVAGVRTVEEARVEAGAGADLIRVKHFDGLVPGLGLGVDASRNSLRFTVNGDVHNAQAGSLNGDRLIVVDDGIDDLVLYRKDQVDANGVVTVGPGNPEPLETTFTGIERVQFLDENGQVINSVGRAGLGGLPGTSARLVVFKHDPFETNDDRFVSTLLGANETINIDPTIDPGPIVNPFGDGQTVPGDEDWYRLEAEVTGTLDIQLFFEEIAALANGRPGLPGNGNLQLFVYDVDGTFIAGNGIGPDDAGNPSARGVNFGDNDGGNGGTGELNVDGDAFFEDERVRIPVVQGQTYYVRINGLAAAINNYNLTIINLAPPVPYDIELDDFPVVLPASPGDACVSIRPPTNAAANNSDTGRSQLDNVTCDATPTIRFRLDDATFLHDLPGNPANNTPPDEIIPIPFNTAQTRDTTVPGYRVAIFNEGTPQQPGTLPQVPIGYARQIAEGVYEFDFGSDAINPALPNGPTTSFVLTDGSHFLSARVQMIDPANPTETGFGPRSVSLEIVVDTVVPPVVFGDLNIADDGLDPASDSGVVGQPVTNTDEITNDTTPTFWGAAEANTAVRVWLDRDADGVVDLPDNDNVLEPGEDVQLAETVAVPLDGTNQFPNGFWTLTSTIDLNNPVLGLGEDGRRLLLVTAEDLAGNISVPARLEIFLDTRGPQVTDVRSINIDGGGLFDVLDPKPLADHGPTPLTQSIRIDFQDLPARVVQSLLIPGGDGPFGFQHEALNRQLAEELGNYRLVGDQNGFIEIVDAKFTSVSASLIPPSPFARGFVTLTFGTPLPDDRYTLTVFDRIKDDAGNALDGESNVIAATNQPDFPSGDEDPGQTFEARFTIDSRPEIGTFCCGSWYIDLNGNGSFDDPNNHDTDAINGDIVFKFGLPGDFPVVGDWDGNGFDEIGVYGRRADGFRFELDLNGNGTFDSKDASFRFANGGRPVAGDWDGVGEDHVAVFDGTQWFKDNTNAAYTSSTSSVPATTISTSARGRPIAADFNGDGDDDVGLYQNNVFQVDFSSDDNFQVDTSITFGFNTTGQLPVAGDWDADGDGNIGLFVTDRNGQFPREAAEWYLDVGPANKQPIFGEGASAGDGLFQPPPTGIPNEPLVFQDIFYQFGDELSEPVVGNFDPPSGGSDGSIPIERPLVRLDDAGSRNAAATPIIVWEEGGEGEDSAAIASSRDIDVFKFTPRDSGRVAVNARKTGSSLDPNLAVYGSSGRVLARNDNSGTTTDSHVEIDVVAGQTYYIQINGSRSTTGNYDVVVDYLLVTEPPAGGGDTTPPGTDPSPDASQIDVGTLGARARGRIDRPGEQDTIVFTPSVSGRLEIRTAALTRKLNTVVEVVDSNGAVIGRSSNTAKSKKNSPIVVDVAGGQDYSIRIRSSGSRVGDYLMALDYLLEGGA